MDQKPRWDTAGGGEVVDKCCGMAGKTVLVMPASNMGISHVLAVPFSVQLPDNGLRIAVTDIPSNWSLCHPLGRIK